MPGFAARVSAAWGRVPKPQLLAILVLWIVFLATQLQKSKFTHCTWGYGLWAAFQVGHAWSFMTHSSGLPNARSCLLRMSCIASAQYLPRVGL